MKKSSSYSSIFYIISFLGYITLFSSCTPVKNIVYFENLQKDTTINSLTTHNFEQKIRKNDILSINIVSPDPISTPLFNGSSAVSTGSTAGTSGGSIPAGYLVDNDGNIALYKLGNVRAAGLTRLQLKQRLQQDLMPFLKDPIVTIRFLNNRVTVLGEVLRPQVINMPNEQLSILEALGQSGDLTFTGRRDNILIIRETENGKQFKRLNLNDKSIFYSPFYYLKPDDVVYVEPTKYKIKSTAQTQQTVGYILSGVTLLITILTLTR